MNQVVSLVILVASVRNICLFVFCFSCWFVGVTFQAS